MLNEILELVDDALDTLDTPLDNIENEMEDDALDEPLDTSSGEVEGTYVPRPIIPPDENDPSPLRYDIPEWLVWCAVGGVGLFIFYLAFDEFNKQ